MAIARIYGKLVWAFRTEVIGRPHPRGQPLSIDDEFAVGQQVLDDGGIGGTAQVS
jgi:hypothetical protein